MKFKYAIFIILTLSLLGCSGHAYKKLEVSSAFRNGEWIPKVYTCDGKNISPPLYIKNIPKSAKSLVIICIDVDAPRGPFYHWIAWNVEPVSHIPPAIPKKAYVESPIKMVQGVNDFGKVGYDGPCPPPGKPHRYYFKVYALDTILKGYYNKYNLMKAIKGHIIAYGEIYGKYQR